MVSPLVDAASAFPTAVVDLTTIASADPVNFHDAMRPGGPAARIDLDALLVFPDGHGPHPTVLIVPGSAGVGPNHVEHAATLVSEGYGACLVDPFTARSVESTVANQTQYSFAASAYDVLAAFAHVCDHPLADADRVSAQGHSRGGAAVVMAAMRPFADAVVGGRSFAGVYAAYPWCGQQFLRPAVGRTAVRVIIGDLDDWCSVLAAQAQVQAIRVAGGDASMRIVHGAHHSFDRHQPVTAVPEARVSPEAPIEFLTDDGSMIDPFTGVADPGRTDLDQFRAALQSGFGRKGAHMGSTGDEQPALFRDDMLAFHHRVLRS